MDDHGNLSPDEEKSKKLLEVLKFLEQVAPDASRQSALERGLPELALNLFVERAGSDDPTVREEARAIRIEHGFELALPDAQPQVPDDE